MKIILAGSELTPLARTGGLGDALEALPAALSAHGHDVSVVLPCYRGLREEASLNMRRTGVEITVWMGDRRLTAGILQAIAPNGVQVFLVENDGYYDRSSIYGTGGRAFDDNAERFIFFSKIVVELARRISPPPEILHVHDWQVALVPALVKAQRLPFRTVLTIHNLAYQGSFWGADFGLTNLPGDFFNAAGVEFYGQLNLLKGGIVLADQITTVSERYAQEIQTPEFGAGLDAVIRENAHKLRGILNGADYDIWNPAKDAALPARYSPESMAGKATCRATLLEKLELEPNPSGPVFAIVSRLAHQKGIDLLIPLLDRLLSHDVRLVILGEGDPEFERELGIASRRHHGRFAYRQGLDESLSHLIYAGTDIFLIPSHFEPCGLSAMYSLKYGAVPIAHATGGLYEMLQDDDPSTDTGNAILYHEDSSDALWDAMLRALASYADRESWSGLIQRGMASDFSWERAVPRYEAVYRIAKGEPPPIDAPLSWGA